MCASAFRLALFSIASEVPVHVSLHLGVAFWEAHTALLATLGHMRYRERMQSILSNDAAA